MQEVGVYDRLIFVLLYPQILETGFYVKFLYSHFVFCVSVSYYFYTCVMLLEIVKQKIVFSSNKTHLLRTFTNSGEEVKFKLGKIGDAFNKGTFFPVGLKRASYI